MSKKKEKKKKRDLDKYPALNPRFNARTRFEVLDMDYIGKLNEEEKQYMNQFMAEYVSGAFIKNEKGEYSGNLNKTEKERKECWTRNNTRNRCVLTVANATGNSVRDDDIMSLIEAEIDHEHEGTASDAVNFIHDFFGGDIEGLEKMLELEMKRDYMSCINPRTSSDRRMAASNYGKRLLELFKNSNLK